MEYYPVVIPTLCRYEKLKKCITSLAMCPEAINTELVIGLDYPPSESYKSGWEQIKNYLPKIRGFRKVTIFERKENLGAARNYKLLEEYVEKKYDAIISTEDDNIFSPLFLTYVNNGLEQYKNDKSIIGICGYSYPVNWRTEKDCILQKQYFSAWGYGKWINKEKELRNSLKNDYFSTKNIKGLRKKMERSPSNFINLMNWALQSEIPAMDITKSFYMFLDYKYILMPKITLVTNDGWDGSGLHCKDKTLIDFRNVKRNEDIYIDVFSAEKIECTELETIIYSLQPKYAIIKANIIYYGIKILGLKNARKIMKLIKSIKT